jgi:hypothetical protein
VLFNFINVAAGEKIWRPTKPGRIKKSCVLCSFPLLFCLSPIPFALLSLSRISHRGFSLARAVITFILQSAHCRRSQILRAANQLLFTDYSSFYSASIDSLHIKQKPCLHFQPPRERHRTSTSTYKTHSRKQKHSEHQPNNIHTDTSQNKSSVNFASEHE